MLFNDPVFLVFLLVLLVFHNPLPPTWRNLLLLAASYYFYGYWDGRFTLLLAFSTLTDYTVALLLERTREPGKRKALLAVSIVVGLAILGFFKYYNFFVDSFVPLFQLFGLRPSISTLEIILPIGISFYTFQTMSYVIDVYQREIPASKNLINFALYVAYFPQLVAGPIERAGRLLPQFERERKITRRTIAAGIPLIFMGYLKKTLISDNIAPIVDRCFLDYQIFDSFYLVMGLVLFSFQIYFDFSGYSDIARGVSKWFGIELMINFNQPYLSTNIAEFWRRWHISLSTWLRDYLYIPLGGNRLGRSRMHLNLMLTMLLGGLWHGASWNFVLWGSLHGCYLVAHKFFQKGRVSLERQQFSGLKNGVSFFFRCALTYLLVLVTWLPFRSRDFQTTLGFLKKIVFWTGPVGLHEAVFLLFMFLVLLLIDLPAYMLSDHEFLLRFPLWLYQLTLLVGGSVIVTSLLMNMHAARQFIYFQF